MHSTLLSLFFILTLLSPQISKAHCDSIDGPVVNDAKRAIISKKIDPVLKWIRNEDENSMKSVFEHTLKVRGLSKEAQKLADLYFFETLVRVHRASEGEGFMGLKKSGQTSTSIEATDKALEQGNIASLADEISNEVRKAVLLKFDKAYNLKKVSEKSPEDGRDYVKSYIELTHFIEGIHHGLDEGFRHKHLKKKNHDK